MQTLADSMVGHVLDGNTRTLDQMFRLAEFIERVSVHGRHYRFASANDTRYGMVTHGSSNH